MSRHLSIAPLIVVGVLIAGAIVVFVVLNQAFGGPSPIANAPYRIEMTVPDSQGLVTKSLVMVRGVHVGEVSRRQLRGSKVDVEIAIHPEKVKVYRDAKARVGHRTLFGEAYLQLDPGNEKAGRLPSGTRLPDRAVLQTQRVDDALEAFDARTRRHIRSLNRTGARVDAEPRAREQLNATIGAFGDTLSELRELNRTIGGQRGAISEFVSSSRSVLDELSSRQDAVETVVEAGASSAAALTADRQALQRTMAESGALLRSSRAALDATAPLIPEARKVVGDLNRAAPSLAPAFTRLRPVSRSTATVISSLPAFNKAAIPFMKRLTTVSELALPVIPRLDPALRNLVPSVEYLSRYERELLGFLESGAGAARKLDTEKGTTSNTGTLADIEEYKRKYDKDGFAEQGVNGAPYGWGRFFVDNTAQTGPSDNIGVNPYPKPRQPYDHFEGNYPRLLPEPPVAP